MVSHRHFSFCPKPIAFSLDIRIIINATVVASGTIGGNHMRSRSDELKKSIYEYVNERKREGSHPSLSEIAFVNKKLSQSANKKVSQF